MNCTHRGKHIGVTQTIFGMEPEFLCVHHQHKETTTQAKCMACPDFLYSPAEQSAEEKIQQHLSGACQHPAGTVVDRYGNNAGVADLYKGATCFLILGGPSTRNQPLHLLGQRGVLIMSFNNNAGSLPPPLRPHIWLHTDPTGKFHDSIWRDPSILKFSPIRDWRSTGSPEKKKGIFHRDSDGRLQQVPSSRAIDMPAVLGFERNSGFNPTTYLFESTINRGNDEKHAHGKKGNKTVQKPNGFPKTINTMFAAVRLAFYLGIKRLYLLGADFNMTNEQPYAFNQAKGGAGVNSNNSAYASMCVMFDALKPHFESAGFEVINCTPDSGLWSFEYRDFEEAVAEVTEPFEQELNCDGWYDPKTKQPDR